MPLYLLDTDEDTIAGARDDGFGRIVIFPEEVREKVVAVVINRDIAETFLAAAPVEFLSTEGRTLYNAILVALGRPEEVLPDEA